ncbi:MAG: NADP-dependent phosphogluconate dehydrogenase [Candidatus Melainabacteria bacterium]|nr:NADP-dependent phosphogluconate dehydrogenase [Candidatus Melainabacteria bacterium]
MTKKAKIGLVGLGVMGENLALNIERNGYPIAVYNRSSDKVDAFLEAGAKGKEVIGCKDVKTFMESLESPRKIILLVKAGAPVDSTIDMLRPFLDDGDIVIDGGNSHYEDTRRREKSLAMDNVFLIGSGVSGGEEGALNGPSLMPGGDKKAYEQIRPIWEAIAAKVDDGPCVTYLGPDGAGHFVKMVHNGIEYGDMQLIAEVYDIMRRGLGMEAMEIAETFLDWNEGILDSYLIEITAKILTVTDTDTKKPLVDLIVDKAGQKGTGRWTSQVALELGVPVPTIDSALTARMLSSMKDERIAASKVISGPVPITEEEEKEDFLECLASALYASKVCSYAQGMALIRAGSKHYEWNINLGETARIWKGGCIIRAELLEEIRKAYAENPELANLLVDSNFASYIVGVQQDWRRVINFAQNNGIAVPALSSSLAYFDMYRTEHLPQNLTQAQRDFFGAHTYERLDKPEVGFVHTDWASMVKERAKKS